MSNPVTIPNTHWSLIESYVDKRLVPLLRKLRDNNWKLDAIGKEEFSNELMHEYAVRVMSMLKGVSEVMVSKDYVVLDYEVTEFREGDYESTRIARIVIGLDENGKIWLREVRDVFESGTCEKYNDIVICLTTDRMVRNALGYDLETPSDRTIKDVGRYRVQGDLIFNVDVLKIGTIRVWYEDSLYALLRWKCLDKYIGELARHGIDFDIDEAYRNTSNPVLRIRLPKRPDERRKNAYEIWERIKKEYYYTLHDYVTAQLSGKSTWTYPVNIENIRIDCHVYPADSENPIETREYTVILRLKFDVDSDNYLMEKLEELLMNHILSDTGHYTFRIGRHEIEAFNVSNPITVFQFPQSWINDIQNVKPLPPDLVLKPVNYPRVVFIVNRDSRVIVRHPEHGEVTIGFDGYYMVEAMTERKISTFTALMNEIAIDRIKQLSKQEGGGQ